MGLYHSSWHQVAIVTRDLFALRAEARASMAEEAQVGAGLSRLDRDGNYYLRSYFRDIAGSQ